MPGCGTGEEAYSTALLLQERLADAGALRPVQLFATDVDEQRLAVARKGEYRAESLAQLSPDQVQRFFDEVDGGHRVAIDLRDVCIFSRHDLFRDPPFSSLDLICCTERLMDLEPAVRQKILALFHYALRPSGVLFLGSSEQLPGDHPLFAALDATHGIFVCNRAVTRSLPEFPIDGQHARAGLPAAWSQAPRIRSAVVESLERLLLARFGPSAAVVDEDGQILHLTGGREGLLRMPEGLVTRSLGDHAQSALRQELRAALAQAVETGAEVAKPDIIVEIQGRPHRLTVTVCPMHGGPETSGLYAVVVQDFGAGSVVETGAALACSHDPMHDVFASTQLAAIFLDRDLKLAKFTPAATALFRFIASDIGRPLSDLAPRFAGTDLLADTREVLSTLLPVEREIRTEDAWFVLRVLPHCAAENVVVGAVITFAEVTRLKRAEAALREAERRKDEFLAVLSHELRNPLAPIRNSLSLLEHGKLRPEQARSAQSMISRQVAHMVRLVDDLLDVTRITRGKIRLKRELLELGSLVERTVEDHRALFTNAGVELAYCGQAGVWVEADRTRTSQIVGNLLQNAAKFTHAGGLVSVTLEMSEQSQAVLRVRDDGVGMSAGVLERLFQPFAQGDQTLDRAKGGLGLGLALVKGLAELHGGSVEGRSDGPGTGAQFEVVLPAVSGGPVAAVAPASAGRQESGMAARSVLIIEDNVDAADSLRELLQLKGHRVEVAYRSSEGLTKARELHPNVILCDIGLPELDGFQVAQAVRADPALADTKLVALTGYAGPRDVARAREAGFDYHLAKPTGVEAIEQVLAQLKLETPPSVGPGSSGSVP